MERLHSYAPSARNRIYNQAPFLPSYFHDYQGSLPIADGSVELLVSQYAGFVSEH